jgi:hypothetical protein
MDYKLFKDVDESVKGLFKNAIPLHHLPSATSRQYSPTASQFFITSDEDLKAMSAQEVQEIFRYRHIVVPGKPSGKKFDRATLRSMGLTRKRHIQGERYIVRLGYFFLFLMPSK